MPYSAIDTMTYDLVNASLEESLESAYLKMKNNKIRHLPVVDVTNKIVGIISDRDVYRGMQPDLRDWHSIQIEKGDFDPADKVKDFMSWPVKAVTYDTDLRVVIERMVKEKVSAFIVTYEDRVAGIVTSEDLLKLLYKLLETKFFKEVPAQQKEKSWIGNLLGFAT
jgi:CBS-domain-containing membrane protein